jgi:hypothetical protein
MDSALSLPAIEGRLERYILAQVATNDLCYFSAVLAHIAECKLNQKSS